MTLPLPTGCPINLTSSSTSRSNATMGGPSFGTNKHMNLAVPLAEAQFQPFAPAPNSCTFCFCPVIAQCRTSRRWRGGGAATVTPSTRHAHAGRGARAHVHSRARQPAAVQPAVRAVTVLHSRNMRNGRRARSLLRHWSREARPAEDTFSFRLAAVLCSVSPRGQLTGLV